MSNNNTVDPASRYEHELEKLKKFTINYGEKILDFSEQQSEKMHRLSDEPSIGDPDDPHEFAGFIMEQNKDFGVSIMADVHAASDHKAPTLRLGAVQIIDNNGSEQFNSMSFFFSVDPEVALRAAKKEGNITRSDLRAVLHHEGTKLEGLSVSSNSGMDKKTNEHMGEFFSLDVVADETSFIEVGELLQDNRTLAPVSVRLIEKVISKEVYRRLRHCIDNENT